MTDLFGQTIPETYYPYDFARSWVLGQGVDEPMTEIELESAWLSEPLHVELLGL